MGRFIYISAALIDIFCVTPFNPPLGLSRIYPPNLYAKEHPEIMIRKICTIVSGRNLQPTQDKNLYYDCHSVQYTELTHQIRTLLVQRLFVLTEL